MLVGCTVNVGVHPSLCFTCSLLLFNCSFEKHWIFLLHFCLLQFRLIEFLSLSHTGFIRRGCRGSRARVGARGGRSAQWSPLAECQEELLLIVGELLHIYVYEKTIKWMKRNK